MIYHIHRYISPLGGITMTGDGEFLTGLRFDGAKQFVPPTNTNLGADFTDKNCAVFDLTDKWLDLYFGGRQPNFTPPLSVSSTPFRQAVWEILLTVPYGQTVSYGEIAQKIARQKGLRRMSAQAVGGAVGHNPVALIIPCHRVVGAKGNLVGYAAGTEKKAALLRLEHYGLKSTTTTVP